MAWHSEQRPFSRIPRRAGKVTARPPARPNDRRSDGPTVYTWASCGCRCPAGAIATADGRRARVSLLTSHTVERIEQRTNRRLIDKQTTAVIAAAPSSATAPPKTAQRSAVQSTAAQRRAPQRPSTSRSPQTQTQKLFAAFFRTRKEDFLPTVDGGKDELFIILPFICIWEEFIVVQQRQQQQ